jgi:hypothetical protein
LFRLRDVDDRCVQPVSCRPSRTPVLEE